MYYNISYLAQARNGILDYHRKRYNQCTKECQNLHLGCYWARLPSFQNWTASPCLSFWMRSLSCRDSKMLARVQSVLIVRWFYVYHVHLPDFWLQALLAMWFEEPLRSFPILLQIISPFVRRAANLKWLKCRYEFCHRFSLCRFFPLE